MRLDSMHLNQLTSKAFTKGEKKERPSSSPTKRKNVDDSCEIESPIKSQNSSPSPLKKAKPLEAISEADSFCTDSSYTCSDGFISAQRKREELRNANKFESNLAVVENQPS